MDATVNNSDTDQKEHTIRKISEALAMPLLNCRNRECRRRLACCGPENALLPVCWSSMPRSMGDPALAFGEGVLALHNAFLLKQKQPEYPARIDPVQMAVAESTIRALIPRRQWKQLRRWFISLGR